MKDIYQLLREKEQLRREVEALRTVAPTLADQSDPAAEAILTDSPGPLSYGPDESVPAGAVFSSWRLPFAYKARTLQACLIISC